MLLQRAMLLVILVTVYTPFANSFDFGYFDAIRQKNGLKKLAPINHDEFKALADALEMHYTNTYSKFFGSLKEPGAVGTGVPISYSFYTHDEKTISTENAHLEEVIDQVDKVIDFEKITEEAVDLTGSNLEKVLEVIVMCGNLSVLSYMQFLDADTVGVEHYNLQKENGVASLFMFKKSSKLDTGVGEYKLMLRWPNTKGPFRPTGTFSADARSTALELLNGGSVAGTCGYGIHTTENYYGIFFAGATTSVSEESLVEEVWKALLTLEKGFNILPTRDDCIPGNFKQFIVGDTKISGFALDRILRKFVREFKFGYARDASTTLVLLTFGPVQDVQELNSTMDLVNSLRKGLPEVNEAKSKTLSLKALELVGEGSGLKGDTVHTVATFGVCGDAVAATIYRQRFVKNEKFTPQLVRNTLGSMKAHLSSLVKLENLKADAEKYMIPNEDPFYQEILCTNTVSSTSCAQFLSEVSDAVGLAFSFNATSRILTIVLASPAPILTYVKMNVKRVLEIQGENKTGHELKSGKHTQEILSLLLKFDTGSCASGVREGFRWIFHRFTPLTLDPLEGASKSQNSVSLRTQVRQSVEKQIDTSRSHRNRLPKCKSSSLLQLDSTTVLLNDELDYNYYQFFESNETPAHVDWMYNGREVYVVLLKKISDHPLDGVDIKKLLAQLPNSASSCSRNVFQEALDFYSYLLANYYHNVGDALGKNFEGFLNFNGISASIFISKTTEELEEFCKTRTLSEVIAKINKSSTKDEEAKRNETKKLIKDLDQEIGLIYEISSEVAHKTISITEDNGYSIICKGEFCVTVIFYYSKHYEMKTLNMVRRNCGNYSNLTEVFDTEAFKALRLIRNMIVYPNNTHINAGFITVDTSSVVTFARIPRQEVEETSGRSRNPDQKQVAMDVYHERLRSCVEKSADQIPKDLNPVFRTLHVENPKIVQVWEGITHGDMYQWLRVDNRKIFPTVFEEAAEFIVLNLSPITAEELQSIPVAGINLKRANYSEEPVTKCDTKMLLDFTKLAKSVWKEGYSSEQLKENLRLFETSHNVCAFTTSVQLADNQHQIDKNVLKMATTTFCLTQLPKNISDLTSFALYFNIENNKTLQAAAIYNVPLPSLETFVWTCAEHLATKLNPSLQISKNLNKVAEKHIISVSAFEPAFGLIGKYGVSSFTVTVEQHRTGNVEQILEDFIKSATSTSADDKYCFKVSLADGFQAVYTGNTTVDITHLTQDRIKIGIAIRVEEEAVRYLILYGETSLEAIYPAFNKCRSFTDQSIPINWKKMIQQDMPDLNELVSNDTVHGSIGLIHKSSGELITYQILDKKEYDIEPAVVLPFFNLIEKITNQVVSTTQTPLPWVTKNRLGSHYFFVYPKEDLQKQYDLLTTTKITSLQWTHSRNRLCLFIFYPGTTQQVSKKESVFGNTLIRNLQQDGCTNQTTDLQLSNMAHHISEVLKPRIGSEEFGILVLGRVIAAFGVKETDPASGSNVLNEIFRKLVSEKDTKFAGVSINVQKWDSFSTKLQLFKHSGSCLARIIKSSDTAPVLVPQLIKITNNKTEQKLLVLNLILIDRPMPFPLLMCKLNSSRTGRQDIQTSPTLEFLANEFLARVLNDPSMPAAGFGVINLPQSGSDISLIYFIFGKPASAGEVDSYLAAKSLETLLPNTLPKLEEMNVSENEIAVKVTTHNVPKQTCLKEIIGAEYIGIAGYPRKLYGKTNSKEKPRNPLVGSRSVVLFVCSKAQAQIELHGNYAEDIMSQFT